MTRIIQTRKVVFGIVLVLTNLLLFFKYAGNETQVGLPRPTYRYGIEVKRSVLDNELHTQHSVEVGERTEVSTPPIIIYNRVPKTGSTTFANIAYSLTKTNHFHMLFLHAMYQNSHYLSVLDQQRFVQNVSLWTEMQPALYHGHLQYLDFTRFGYKNPIYINIVRDPIERLVSYYYFLRHGDDFRPHLKRARAQDNKTLDDCIRVKDKDCDLNKMLWIQIPFFCGQSPQCLVPDRWALYQAKNNLLNHFLLVGVTEQLGDFIALLETMLPQYFSGAYNLYSNSKLGHLRNTKDKITPSEKTLTTIRNTLVYQLEQEFYEFARNQFNFLKFRTLTKDEDGRAVVNPPGFKYEKIMPAP